MFPRFLRTTARTIPATSSRTPITITTVPTIATGFVNPAEAPDEPNGEEMMFPALSYQIALPALGKALQKSEKPP